MRRFLVVSLTAVVLAATVTAVSTPRPLGQAVIRAQTTDTLPQLADKLTAYPPAVQLAFLDYAGDRSLVLAAERALVEYPQKTPRILRLYGRTPDFKEILRRYGSNVVPPIHYLLNHDPASLGVRDRIARLFADDVHESPPPSDNAWLPPRKRGAYAIGFIRNDGHNFLGQFALREDGEVVWLQSERAITGAKEFLTGGITGLDRKLRLDQPTDSADYAWAAVDVLGPILAFKVAQLGKVAARTGRAGRGARRSSRLARAGVDVARGGRLTGRAAKIGLAGGALYIVAHPSLVNDLAASAARALGVPPWLLQSGVWFVILLPLLWLLQRLWRWLLRPVCRVVVRPLIVYRQRRVQQAYR